MNLLIAVILLAMTPYSYADEKSDEVEEVLKLSRSLKSGSAKLKNPPPFDKLGVQPVTAQNSDVVDKSMFPNAKKDIEVVLDHKIFSSYLDHNITNIRQGEIGESMAYFVSLEKPFESSPLTLCFIFMSKESQKWELRGPVEKCKSKKPCSCAN